MDLLNPFGLDATGLMVWGSVAHAIADWPLQTDWMSAHKAARRRRPHPNPGPDLYDKSATVPGPWWDRHPAAYTHAGVHLVFLLPVFGLLAVAIALVHLVIDTRTPVAWWSRLVRQTQPSGQQALAAGMGVGGQVEDAHVGEDGIRIIGRVRLDSVSASAIPVVDVGMLVRFNVDQVFHLAVLAAAALAMGVMS